MNDPSETTFTESASTRSTTPLYVLIICVAGVRSAYSTSIDPSSEEDEAERAEMIEQGPKAD